MKRILKITLTVLFLLIFVACGQTEEGSVDVDGSYEEELYSEQYNVTASTLNAPQVSWDIDEMEFHSLTEFLESYVSATRGRSAGEASRLEESVGLMALEELYLPIGIPNAYRLFRILVNENFVSFWYLQEEDLISEDTILDALINQRHFLFSFTRWDWGDETPFDRMLEHLRVSEIDLIDEKYYFDERNRFVWASDNERMSLYIPMPTTSPRGEHSIPDGAGGFMAFSLNEPPIFTQIRVVDLTDEEEVEALIQEQIPTQHLLTFRLDRYTEHPDFGEPISPINILSGNNILEFLLANHDGFAAEDPTRDGYEFMGWYLNPAFVTPLTEITRMPARDVTLYARWQPLTPPTPPDIHTIIFYAQEGYGTFDDGDFSATTITIDIEHGNTPDWIPWPYEIVSTWLFDDLWLLEDTDTIFATSELYSLEITEDMTFIAQYRFGGIEMAPLGVPYPPVADDR